MNIVIVHGRLLERPRTRILADGRSVATGTVLVNHPEHGQESVPFSWFEPPARAQRLEDDTEVVACGRITRRFFRTGGRTDSLTDLVVTNLLPATNKRRIASALRNAIAPVEERVGESPSM